MAAILAMPRGFTTAELVRAGSWVVVVTASILVHELGHAFAARSAGGSASIELYAMGGVARHEHKQQLSCAQRAWVSFAGPLAGFVVGAVVLLVGSATAGFDSNGLAHTVHRQLLWVNVGWGALNLLPLLPLDGGQILHAALDARLEGKGARPAQLVSVVVGALCVGLALWQGWIWAALIAGWCASSSYGQLRHERLDHQDRPLWDEYERLREGEHQRDEAETLELLESLLSRARSDALRAAIVSTLSWHHLIRDRLEQAVHSLSRMPPGQGPTELLAGTLLFAQGRAQDAIPLLRHVVEQQTEEGEFWERALCTLCEAHVENAQADQAMQLIRAHAPRLQTAWALSQLDLRLFQAGHFALAAEVGEMAFLKSGDDLHAYNTACSHARIPGSEPLALDWLQKAVDAGYDNLQQLDGDSDFDTLRRLPEFVAIRKQLER